MNEGTFIAVVLVLFLGIMGAALATDGHQWRHAGQIYSHKTSKTTCIYVCERKDHPGRFTFVTSPNQTCPDLPE